MPESTKEKFERWLSDGTTFVGVFENHDLGHCDVGLRVAFPYDISQWDSAIVGQSRAPDTAQFGFGWRYVLIGKCKNADEALVVLEGVKNEISS